jgi:hypothetical protein
MYPTQLQQILGRGGLVAGNLRDALALCEGWYAAEPSLTTFTLLSLSAHLAGRGWSGDQGAPQAEDLPFENIAQPHLRTVVGILAATPAATPIAELDALTVAYQASLRATP